MEVAPDREASELFNQLWYMKRFMKAQHEYLADDAAQLVGEMDMRLVRGLKLEASLVGLSLTRFNYDTCRAVTDEDELFSRLTATASISWNAVLKHFKFVYKSLVLVCNQLVHHPARLPSKRCIDTTSELIQDTQQGTP